MIACPYFGRALLIKKRRVLKVVDLELVSAALMEFLALRDGVDVRDAITDLYVYILNIGVGATLAKHLDQIGDPLLIFHVVGVVD